MKGIRGSEYDFVYDKERIHITCHIAGEFSLSNSLTAIAAAKELGYGKEIIEKAMESLFSVAGRMEQVAIPDEHLTVIVDYAHTPDALENVLDSILGCRKEGQRLVCIFGCGGDRDHSKRPLMGRIASQGADYVILTADNSRSERTADILSDILRGIEDSCSHTVIENRREAITYAITSAKENDVILLCGKGHEEYEIMPDGIHPFSERAIVLEAVEKRLKSKGLY